MHVCICIGIMTLLLYNITIMGTMGSYKLVSAQHHCNPFIRLVLYHRQGKRAFILLFKETNDMFYMHSNTNKAFRLLNIF